MLDESGPLLAGAWRGKIDVFDNERLVECVKNGGAVFEGAKSGTLQFTFPPGNGEPIAVHADPL